LKKTNRFCWENLFLKKSKQKFTVTFYPDQIAGFSIKNYGFNLTGNDLIASVKDSTGGFTTVIDG